MKKVYSGYYEKCLIGEPLKQMYNESFFCGKKHHYIVFDLTIKEYLNNFNILDEKMYRIFHNDSFCVVFDLEIEEEICFFAHQTLKNSSYEDKHNNRNVAKCPNCSESMFIKEGPYGPFWGCNNYPGCKEIKKIYKLGEIQVDGQFKEWKIPNKDN